ncbi:MAG: hypothetical protein V4772_03260 [Pseudomonadota bacterium]
MTLRGLTGLMVLLIMLTGCAANPKNEAIKADLKKVQSSSEILSVPGHLSYKFVGAFGKIVQINLLPGAYHLEWQNSIGRFYAGERYCVWWELGDKFVLSPGGVWVPHDPLDTPRFYILVGQGQVTGKSLDEVVMTQAIRVSPDPQATITGQSINAIMNSPVRISPGSAGLGAGIAAAVIAGMLDEADYIMLYSEPLPESLATLRAGLVIGQ